MRKNKLRGILTCLAIVPLFVCTVVNNDRMIGDKNDSIIASSEISNNQTVVNDSTVSLKDSIRLQLVDEVTAYVNNKFPTASTEIPTLLVDYGLNNNIDIVFMMAQTEIETGFGTVGIGRHKSRKSLFGIYKTYQSYEECVQHYVATLFKHYLTRGRTTDDLMKKYVTTGGLRYAEAESYEVKISSAHRAINKKTNVKTLQSAYNEI